MDAELVGSFAELQVDRASTRSESHVGASATRGTAVIPPSQACRLELFRRFYTEISCDLAQFVSRLGKRKKRSDFQSFPTASSLACIGRCSSLGQVRRLAARRQPQPGMGS